MRRFLPILILLTLSVNVFAQDTKIYSMDGKRVIEHPTCRVEISSSSLFSKIYSMPFKKLEKRRQKYQELAIKELSKKGYRVLNLGSAMSGKKESIQSDVEDLSFFINHNIHQYDLSKDGQSIFNQENLKIKNFRENFKERPEDYLKEVMAITPECISLDSGLKINSNYNPLIEKYELEVCAGQFYAPYEKFLHQGKRKAFNVYHYAFPLSIPFIVPSTATALPVIGLMVGGFALYAVLFKGIESEEDLFFDGLYLTRSVLKCVSDGQCNRQMSDLQLSMSKRGYKRLTKYVSRMDFENFSNKVANYIIQERACSNPNGKLKNYKKLFKKARKSF